MKFQNFLMSIVMLTIFTLSTLNKVITLFQSYLEVIEMVFSLIGKLVKIIEKTLEFVECFLSVLKDIFATFNTHLKLWVENKKQSENQSILLIGSTNSKPSKKTHFENYVLKVIFAQTTQDSLESQIINPDSLESEIVNPDSLESEIINPDSLESENSDFSKITVKKARELISEKISKDKSLVAPKKNAKKQILINWLTDNL